MILINRIVSTRTPWLALLIWVFTQANVDAQTSMRSTRLPIGQADFKSVVDSDRKFVDKTLLIKAIIENPATAILITRPRRWGKTLNLSMLRYFFGVTVDAKGNSLDENLNRELFKDLNIFKATTRVKDHEVSIMDHFQGKYPIVYLSFKDGKGKTLTEMKMKVGREIYNLYKNHAYLKESQRLDEESRKVFSGLLDSYFRFSQADIDQEWLKAVDLSASLQVLIEYLHRHHDKKVYVLIDEYDALLNDLIGDQLFKEAIAFMRSMLSPALKDNEHLEKAVVTGILRIAKSNMFSGLNNFEEDNLLTSTLSKYYGFTETEVTDLLKPFVSDTELQDVKSWYNGYLIGGETIYNPWSVIKYVSTRKLDPYWVATSTDQTSFVDRLMIDDRIQEDLERLRSGKLITKVINKELTADDQLDKPDAIWPLLFNSGYLTLVKNSPDSTSVPRTNDLEIPNFEVNHTFIEFFDRWLQKENYPRQEQIGLAKILVDAISNDNDEAVQKALKLFRFNSTEKWNYTPLHVAALTANAFSFKELNNRFPHMLDQRTNERQNLADFAVLGKQPLPDGINQEPTFEQPGLTSWLCTTYYQAACLAAGGSCLKIALDWLLKRQLTRLWSELEAVATATAIGVLNEIKGLAWASTCGAARKYAEINSSNPTGDFTFLQLQKYVLENRNSYVSVNGCKKDYRSVVEVFKPLFDYRLPRKVGLTFTLCEPIKDSSGPEL